jgi:hypothetical protein
MVAVLELGPYGIPPPGAVLYTLIVNGKATRLAFIEVPDAPPDLEGSRSEPGEPEYWH